MPASALERVSRRNPASTAGEMVQILPCGHCLNLVQSLHIIADTGHANVATFRRKRESARLSRLKGRDVGVAAHDLGMLRDQVPIEVREQLVGVDPADRRQDHGDVGIDERVVEIGISVLDRRRTEAIEGLQGRRPSSRWGSLGEHFH